MYRFYCRTYQTIFRIAALFLPWRRPELLEGAGCLAQLPARIRQKGIHRVLIVTDRGIMAAGLLDNLIKALDETHITNHLYDGTVANPTIENIEEGLNLYHAHSCEAIIAIGGGSPIDCAKGIGARVARPGKRIPQMKGELRILKKTPPVFAVPTTSGTGSEATLAAVVSDIGTKDKYALNDPVLIPYCAVLDPLLTLGLPPHITSTTGMDALTHAVEAFIGRSSTSEARQCSRDSVKLIFENLYKAYQNGDDLDARINMQKASYLAGIAFTRAYVGYVHAIAHTLGGFYGIPHGLANAIILPHVLAYYGSAVYRPLAELAQVASIGDNNDTEEQRAKKFIEHIRQLNKAMGIPEKINGIKEADIPQMAERASKEANPLYPVPKILYKHDLIKLYNQIKA